MNWKQIDTSTEEGRQQLRREIAERLGWHAIVASGKWLTGFKSGEIAYTVPLREIPDYPNDLNAAVSLTHPNAFLDLMIIPERNEAIAAFIEHGDRRRTSEKARTPAEAVCRAWLAYMDAKAAQS